VRKILTNEIKEKVIYRHLEEGKLLPSIHEMLNPKPNPFARDWSIDDLQI